MARITRKVKVSSDGTTSVKIDGLQLFPVTRVELCDGDEITFIGKNGKYKAQDGTPWQPVVVKLIDSIFEPIGNKEDRDQTSERVRLAVMRNQTVEPGTEWDHDKEYKEVDSIDNGVTLLKEYNGGPFEFIYTVKDNIVEYKIIRKPTNWQWSI